jgi:mRNA-degrading endonuclease RelE of RelBE toxin-antitoxin system
MFTIDITIDAIEDMQVFRKHECRRIFASIEDQLTHQPEVETRNRKPLQPNDLAEWELRLDPFRVFYDIDHTAEIVNVIAIGKKAGNRLYIRGVEYKL